jgi:hypothetical protein
VASKRHIRRRSCESKKKFDTKELAHAFLSYLRATKKYTGDVYACKHCGGFHVGRPARNTRVEITRKRRAVFG